MFKTQLPIAGIALAAALAGAPAWAQPAMATRDFVNAAAQSDQYEIFAGRLMTVQGQDARVKAFAQEMIDQHVMTRKALQDATKASGLEAPPATLGGDQQAMLSALQSMKGADLDRAYLTQQVNAHTAALVTQQAYAMSGADPNVRKAAQSAIPLIQRHLQMAQQMKASTGGT